MTSTHDLPTVAGWWRGSDLDSRKKFGMLGTDESRASGATAPIAIRCGAHFARPRPLAGDAACNGCDARIVDEAVGIHRGDAVSPCAVAA